VRMSLHRVRHAQDLVKCKTWFTVEVKCFVIVNLTVHYIVRSFCSVTVSARVAESEAKYPTPTSQISDSNFPKFPTPDSEFPKFPTPTFPQFPTPGSNSLT